MDEKLKTCLDIAEKHFQATQTGQKLVEREFPVKSAVICDLIVFLAYIAASDGKINTAETELINKLSETFFLPFKNNQELIDFIQENNLYTNTEAFETSIPNTLKMAVETDIAAGNTVEKNLSWTFYNAFYHLGKEMIAADGNEDTAEVDRFTLYMNLLEQYIKSSLSETEDTVSLLDGDDEDVLENDEDAAPLKANDPVPSVPNSSSEGACVVKKEADSKSLEELMAELNSLTGLKGVKENVASLVNLLHIRKMREERGMPQLPMSLHLVFSGNPGTGKTTVARLLAGIYKELGVLSKGQLVEVDRSGLVGGYIGQTPMLVQNVVNSALGGILFIDEAYSLTVNRFQNDYGFEAVDTLLKCMEDHRNDLIVIVAGYPKPMEEFLQSNPGLRSRFNRYLTFEDYTPDELQSIFEGFCSKAGYTLSPAAGSFSSEYFKKLYANRKEDFANGREVRNFFENAVARQADRLSHSTEFLSDEELIQFVPDDLQSGAEQTVSYADIQKSEYLSDKLSDLTPFSISGMTVSLPSNWKHEHNDQFGDYFYENGSSHGFFYISVKPFLGGTQVDPITLFETLFSGLKSSAKYPEKASYTNIFVSGYPAMNAHMTTENNAYAASGIVLANDRLYSIMYGDTNANEENVDEFLKKTLETVKIEQIDEPEPVPGSNNVPKGTDMPGKYKVVSFGRYSQGPHGEEKPIEWLILDQSAGGMLLLSKYALDAKPFFDANVNSHWSRAYLRNWLNTAFLNAAFTKEEQEMILLTECRSKEEACPKYHTDPGPNTQDKVFLLSYKQAFEQYFPTDKDRLCLPTEYMTAGRKMNFYGKAYCWWWLRSSGKFQNGPCMVLYDGSLDHDMYDGANGAVRPAIWVKRDSFLTNETVDEIWEENSFERALNRGMDLTGALVRFKVREYRPDSALGYNAWAGEHLNFISAKDLRLTPGQSILAKVLSCRNVLRSWRVDYTPME